MLPALLALRWVINVGIRMAYTFLPAFARGSGLSVSTMGWVVSARELTALSAPVSGRIADRLGSVRVLGYSGLLAAGGLLGATLGAPGLIIGFLIFGIARTAYIVAMNSWIGEEVAYKRRGRVTGIVELTWGGAALVGLPLVGLLIDRVGWWAAPGILGLLAVPLSVKLLTVSEAIGPGSPGSQGKPNMSRGVIATFLALAAMTASAQFVFIGHGLWLEDTYDLGVSEVGLAIIAVGLVEVFATLGSAGLTDRLGKRVSIVSGALLMTVMVGALAAFPSPPLPIGLLMLVLVFMGYEFGLVSSIPLISQLDPNARAQMVGRAVGIFTVVRAVGTPVSTAIYLNQGFATLMTVSAIFGLASVVLALTLMPEPRS